MRGRSCFTWGALLYVLTGAVHAAAHFAPPTKDPLVRSAQEAMAKATQSMAGMAFTLESRMNCLSWFMTTFSVMTGLVALSLRGRCGSDVWLLRQVSALLAIGAGVLAAIALRSGIAPALGLYGLTSLLFAVATVRAKAKAPRVPENVLP